jgi:hypothetical protein
LIRKRCEEGIERAKAKGVTFGRKRKLDKEMVRVAAERYAKGDGRAGRGLWRQTACASGGCAGLKRARLIHHHPLHQRGADAERLTDLAEPMRGGLKRVSHLALMGLRPPLEIRSGQIRP